MLQPGRPFGTRAASLEAFHGGPACPEGYSYEAPWPATIGRVVARYSDSELGVRESDAIDV